VTVLRSASGTRIECDACGSYAVSSTLPVDALRLEAGFVHRRDRDWCPGCWRDETRSRFPGGFEDPRDDGPAAA
jgi:hypothetical protein